MLFADGIGPNQSAARSRPESRLSPTGIGQMPVTLTTSPLRKRQFVKLPFVPMSEAPGWILEECEGPTVADGHRFGGENSNQLNWLLNCRSHASIA